MSDAAGLRARAEELAAPFPPLLADAKHLAQTVLLGAHGRRRPGTGDEFWQYRAAVPGDELRLVDWRRSARSDTQFVREMEWQSAQSVLLWADMSASMSFSSDKDLARKSDRAAILALALSVLLINGGERVGLSGAGLAPRSGQLQLLRLAGALSVNEETRADFGAPDTRGIPPRSRAVFLSDFLGDLAPVEAALFEAADRGVAGALVQILDPQEEAFPFDGRTIFESMAGSIQFETLKARDLRDRYLDRLADRKARLDELCRITGWHYHCHHTNTPATSALLWLFGALERGS